MQEDYNRNKDGERILNSRDTITNNHLMRLFAQFEGEVDLADFTVEEIEQMLSMRSDGADRFKENYFAYYNDVKDKSLKGQDW